MKVTIGLSITNDIGWLRVGRRIVVVRSPRCKPSFSERHGYVWTVVRIGEWRLSYEVDPKPKVAEEVKRSGLVRVK